MHHKISNSIVWRSTDDSRAAGMVSLWAIGETILASAGGIYLFFWTDWKIVTLTSLIIAVLKHSAINLLQSLMVKRPQH